MLNCGFSRLTAKNWWKRCYVRCESSECFRYQGYQRISQQSGRFTTNFSILMISQDPSEHKHHRWWVTWYCSCFEIWPHVTRQTSLHPQTWHGPCVTPPRAQRAVRRCSTPLRSPQRTAGPVASPGPSWRSPSAPCSQTGWLCDGRGRRTPSPSKSPTRIARGRAERWTR